MGERVEIRNTVRVYVSDPSEAPDHVQVHESKDNDLPDGNEYYYELAMDELAEKLQKRFIFYDGEEGTGYFDTVRNKLTVTRTRGVGKEDKYPSQKEQQNQIKNEILKRSEEVLEKYKVYISDASTMGEAQEMAPEGVDVQVSDNGSFYYDKLPGGGDGDDAEYETGDYDVDTKFGEIMADRVLDDDVSGIPVDDFHEYLDEVDDPDLVRDALIAEMEGPDRKTGKQFIEKRARELGIDVDNLQKESGPDVTTGASPTSLIDQEIDPSTFSDETITSPETSDYVDQEWTLSDIWGTYIEGDRRFPTGMGNPDDIPTGTLTTHLKNEVDDPAVLMKFWTEGNYQIRSDIEDKLRNMGYEPRAEEIPGEYRFDLDSMTKSMPDDRISNLESGDIIYIDDYADGFKKAEVEEVSNLSVVVSDPGMGGTTMEIPYPDVRSDEFAFASFFETDGFEKDGLHHYNFPDDVLNRIDDSSLLSRARGWDEYEGGHALRGGNKDALKRRLSEVKPPDPEQYGMSEEAMDTLHNASWPTWPESSHSVGPGLSPGLRDVYENASTEDLESYKEACEDNDLDRRGEMLNGMLFYRDDSDVGINDVFEYEQVAHGNYSGVSDDSERRIMDAAEETMSNLRPDVGAQLAGHVEKIELQMPPDGSNWAGQSQRKGRTVAIDDPFAVERTTSHEMGHAFHNLLGIKNDGYGTIDNRDKSGSPDRWIFGSKRPNNGNEISEGFYDDIQAEWEAYKETQQGKRDDAQELRRYQKRHGVEMMAVGFAHWNMDPFKVRTRHPDLAEVFDQYAGEGVTEDIEPSEMKGEYIDIAGKGGKKATVRVDDVTDVGYSTDYELTVVDGDQSMAGTMPEDEFVVERVNDEYEPIRLDHGTTYTIETSGGEQTEAVIDKDTAAYGGDFLVRNAKTGETIDQMTRDQFREKIVDDNDPGEIDIPWTPDRASKSDLVELDGTEMSVRMIDTFDRTLTFEDASGDTRTLSYEEIYDEVESGNMEAISSEIEWDEIQSNEEYTFIEPEGGRYTGEVVGFNEDYVEFRQESGDQTIESTIDRDEIEQIRMTPGE